uniref:Serine carboxypeptidase n=1 Tax=Oryza sativa subsp. japonica TaxID=39947 RepID=Q8W3C5_ORYSJ|nr:Putative serine carboxypeptidase [Oryza sativa Japonica Group]AAM08632.1 Putative serine carboxypeptidase [Oryza sativa Japonica Group]
MATTRATSTLLLLLLLVSATWAASAPTTSRARNVITHVKGFQGRLPFHLETGYVEVDNTNTVELFYYFIQSERSPADDPLILWITGGPGCSALSGLLFEIGTQLYLNYFFIHFRSPNKLTTDIGVFINLL